MEDLRPDAGTRIPHHNADSRLTVWKNDGVGDEIDSSASGTEGLHRILNQINEHLLELSGVGPDGPANPALEVHFDPSADGIARRDFNTRSQYRLEIDRA